MNQNSKAITIFCSHLCKGENTRPLEPKEWSELAVLLVANKLEPADVLNFSAEDFNKYFNFDDDKISRMQELIARSASMTFELNRYEAMGISIVTRADFSYPKNLKKLLKNSCPPLFYYSGGLALLDNASVGYVGSRNINDEDERFTLETVQKTVQLGYGVVSGGAKGVDSIAQGQALRLGSWTVAFLSDSLQRKIKSPEIIEAIQNKKLLLLSAVNPDAGFSAGIAMMRNRYIYAQSVGTVVVKSDYKKGGTWNGASDNLRHNFCNLFCWDNIKYDGNLALIKNGALPINEKWDGNVKIAKQAKAEQISMFGE